MPNAKFRIKNGLEIVETADDLGTLTLVDGEVISDSTLTVFPKATSGTNTAGNDMIVQGGAGTGSGAGGAIKFNVAVAGGSGSSANTLETKMQIASTGIVTMTDGTNATATNNGTLVVTGGVGISSNLFANAGRFTGGIVSSSSTTGALIVTGGTGISEDLYVGEDVYVGDNLSLTSSNAVLSVGDDSIFKFGADDDVLLTHVPDVGLQLSTIATSGANPVFEIYQDNADANGGVLRFKKEAGDAGTGQSADNDKLGVIQFFGDDDADAQNNFGTIEGRIADASNNDELGRLMLRPRADKGTAGGVIIDGFTIEGILNQKHALRASIGGNYTSDSSYTVVESGSGSVINMFQYPSDNADNSSQHFSTTGTGDVVAYDVVPILNIGGGSTPHSFTGNGEGSGDSNYYPNLMVNGTGYSEARIQQVTAQGESNTHAGLGAAMVIETVDKHNFNGIFFSKDSDNHDAFGWNTNNPSTTLGDDETWALGKTTGTDGLFQIGYYPDGYEDAAISTTKNPLLAANRLMSIHKNGGVGIDGVAASTSAGLVVGAGSQTYSSNTNRTMNILLNGSGGLGPLGVYVHNSGGYASGSTSAIAVDDSSGGSATLTGITSGKKLYDSSGNLVGTVSSASANTINFAGNTSHVLADDEQLYGMLGGIIYFESSQATPSITANKLYNYNGSLYWNGSDLTAAAASALGDLSDVTYSTSGGSAGDLSITGLDTFTMSEADTVMKIIDTSDSGTASGGKLTLGSDDGAEMADNERLGVIDFVGAEDASNTQSLGARIQAVCRDAWDGTNNDADLEFYTVNGTTVAKVLTLDADKLASFEGDVIITGDLTVSGNTVQQDVETVTVEDPLIQLARANTSSDTLDIGFYGTYADGGTKYTGLFRDASDGDTYKLFATTGNSHAEPTTTVDTTSGFTLADLDVGVLDSTTLSINTSGTQDAIITSGSQAIAAITDGNSGTIDSFSVSSYPATKYLILVEDKDSNEFMSSEILALGHSTDFAELTQYALLYSDTELGTFSVANSSGTISLTYAANTAGTNSNGHKVRVVATRIAAI